MGKRKIQGVCRLCLTNGWLVDSHIIPKFFYKPLKEEKGSFLYLSNDPNEKEDREQKGITEYLLCETCDTKRLQKYEDYLARVIFGNRKLKTQHSKLLIEFSDYDYKKVKSALISILWRMSITSDPFFKEVNLGTRHLEKIRSALLNDSEFQEEEYPVSVAAPLFEGKFLSDMMVPPSFVRLDGNRVYRCVISGLLFHFFVGSATLDGNDKRLLLRRTSWPILKVPAQKIPFLWDILINIGRARTIRNK